ncbi:MAG: hypothetical protein ACM34I_09970 [bacterium]
MQNDTVFHNWLVDYLQKKLSRDYRESRANHAGEEKESFKGLYPDLILGNHGMVLALVEVETEETITADRGEYWKKLSQSGTKLILMVPEQAKAKVTDLLWKNGIMHNVSVGSYSIKVAMP